MKIDDVSIITYNNNDTNGISDVHSRHRFYFLDIYRTINTLDTSKVSQFDA